MGVVRGILGVNLNFGIDWEIVIYLGSLFFYKVGVVMMFSL